MRCSVNRLLQLATKPRLQSMRSDTSSHVWPSASSKISRARRASSARSVRLLARRVSSISSEFDNVMASLMDAIIVYKWLLQSTSPTGNQLVDQGAHRFFVDTLSCDGCGWAQQHLRMRLPLLRLRWITRGGLLREGRRDGDPETNTCEEATAQKSAMRGNAVIHRLRSGKECVQQSGILA